MTLKCLSALTLDLKPKLFLSDLKHGLPTAAIIRSTNYPLDQMAQICSILAAKPINTCQVLKNIDSINLTRKKTMCVTKNFYLSCQKMELLK